MPRVNRAHLLQQLEIVQAGLAPREIVEQSNSFVFVNGEVCTYNDDVACRAQSPAGKDVTGAVRSGPLLKLLGKMTEDDLDLDVDDGELVVSAGRRKQTRFRMDAAVTLPIDKIPVPKDKAWKPVPEDFGDAVGMVESCAGTDESKFITLCINIHPKWLEASDNLQVIRYRIETGLPEATLVKRDSLRHVTGLGVTEFAMTDNWIHFRNKTVQMACRRFVDPYPSAKATEILKRENAGAVVVLPKSLGDAADRAEVFSGEDADNNQVDVELRPGKVRVTGSGASGRHQEILEAQYDGEPLRFRIAPHLLRELVRRHNECQIGASLLHVFGDRFTYAVSLGAAPSEKE